MPIACILSTALVTAISLGIFLSLCLLTAGNVNRRHPGVSLFCDIVRV
jgi:hypothetical protein